MARETSRANEDARLTKPTINPYEPTHPATLDGELVSLRFDGVIERADYQRMLPRGEQEWWLCLVLAVLLGICILVFGPASVVLAISKGQPLVGLGLVAFWTLMLAGLWFLKRRVSASDRATRYLKLYPDVLGTAQGEFTAGGLAFHDGVHTYWFGPQHLLRTAICADGMRVYVDASAHRYLALSLECSMRSMWTPQDNSNATGEHWQKCRFCRKTPVGWRCGIKSANHRPRRFRFVVRLLQKSNGELQPSETRHSLSRVRCCSLQPSFSSFATEWRFGCSGAAAYL